MLPLYLCRKSSSDDLPQTVPTILLETTISLGHFDLRIRFPLGVQSLTILPVQITQRMVCLTLAPGMLFTLILTGIEGQPSSSIRRAGQPPRILSKDEQEKMRVVCKARIPAIRANVLYFLSNFFYNPACTRSAGHCCITRATWNYDR